MFLWSMALAILAASTRWSVEAITGATFSFVSVSAALAMAWGAISIVSVRKYGREGLWVLLGAPLALFWPVVFCLMWYACEHGADCM
jgi:hypothetical protein